MMVMLGVRDSVVIIVRRVMVFCLMLLIIVLVVVLRLGVFCVSVMFGSIIRMIGNRCFMMW